MKKDFVLRFWKAKADMKNTEISIPNTVLDETIGLNKMMTYI